MRRATQLTENNNHKIVHGQAIGAAVTNGVTSQKGAESTGDGVHKGTHKAIWVIFASLLVDLLAFTIILPLLPSLLEYYRNQDKGDGLYSRFMTVVESFRSVLGAPERFSSVLMGGVLGSMFSGLQFLASPITGALSDVYGRKRIMIISGVFEALSYGLWAWSSSFEVFVLARIIGGLSKANISLSTAVVTDVSTVQTRTKGMALIGIAFAVGFIVGPITGAMFSIWYKNGSNPFQGAALLAFALSIVDALFLAVFYKETLPQNKRSKSVFSNMGRAYQFINPSALFQFSAIDKISAAERHRLRRYGLVYFLYLFFYSGMEFTLTFLMHTQHSYTSVQQGKMFLFVGLIMAAIQGGYVRRIQPGRERKVALTGILVIVPSFVIVGFATEQVTLYCGLILYAFASATVVPCLTTLVSTYGSHSQKGVVLGIFRSLGALARAVGPITACTVYWMLGPQVCYILGGTMLLLPWYMLKITKQSEDKTQ